MSTVFYVYKNGKQSIKAILKTEKSSRTRFIIRELFLFLTQRIIKNTGKAKVSNKKNTENISYKAPKTTNS